MFCNVCHTQLPASSAFCPQCGTTLASDSASETMVRPDLLVKQEETAATATEKSSSGTTQEPYIYPPAPPIYPPAPPNILYNNVPASQDYYHPVSQGSYPYPYNVLPPPIAIPLQSRPPKRRLRTAVVLSIIVVVLLTSCVTIVTGMSNAINNGLKTLSTTQSGLSTAQNTNSSIVQQPNPYAPFRGQLVLADPLGDNSQGYRWNEVNNASLYCQFAAGAYHLRLPPQSKYQVDWCFATSTNYSNLAFEIEMTMTKGDCAGLIFHNAGDRQLYYFCITHLGGYGLYLYYKNTLGAVQVKELAKGNSPLIYTGYNVKNLIGVSANNGTLNLYVNHKQIQSVVDKTFLQGEIGLATHEYDSRETDVFYQNAKVWTF